MYTLKFVWFCNIAVMFNKSYFWQWWYFKKNQKCFSFKFTPNNIVSIIGALGIPFMICEIDLITHYTPNCDSDKFMRVKLWMNEAHVVYYWSTSLHFRISFKILANAFNSSAQFVFYTLRLILYFHQPPYNIFYKILYLDLAIRAPSWSLIKHKKKSS